MPLEIIVSKRNSLLFVLCYFAYIFFNLVSVFHIRLHHLILTSRSVTAGCGKCIISFRARQESIWPYWNLDERELCGFFYRVKCALEVHRNLFPRAFPLQNGWGGKSPTHFLREKPWGRGSLIEKRLTAIRRCGHRWTTTARLPFQRSRSNDQ